MKKQINLSEHDEKLVKELEHHNVEVPIYDLKSQFEYIMNMCKDFDFNHEHLVSLILAEFIYTFQEAVIVKKCELSAVFVSYLEHCVKTRKKFDKLKEKFENGKNSEKTDTPVS